MDEYSWRADLVKAGIHITYIDMDNGLVYFDFAYRPHSGDQRVWGKSVIKVEDINGLRLVVVLKDEVLKLRKRLED